MAKKRSTKAKKKTAKKRQKMTPNQAEFAKQQQRIRRFIKTAEKRGYSFPANVVPDRPARVTKRDIARITAIKPKTLYEQATYTFPTGETISGTERRHIERQYSAQKARLTREIKKSQYNPDDYRYHTTAGYPPAEATDVADRLKETLERFNRGKSEYEKVMDEIKGWEPSVYWNAWFSEIRTQQVNQMERMISAAVENNGFAQAMRAIGAQPEAFHYAANVIMYDSKQDAIANSFVALAEILKSTALTADDLADLEILSDAVNGYQDEEIEV